MSGYHLMYPQDQHYFLVISYNRREFFLFFTCTLHDPLKMNPPLEKHCSRWYMNWTCRSQNGKGVLLFAWYSFFFYLLAYSLNIGSLGPSPWANFFFFVACFSCSWFGCLHVWGVCSGLSFACLWVVEWIGWWWLLVWL